MVFAMDMDQKLNTNMKDTLTGSEALYGFCAWLSTQDEETTMSSRHDSGHIAELIDRFIRCNNLNQPTDDWTDRYMVPRTKSDNVRHHSK